MTGGGDLAITAPSLLELAGHAVAAFPMVMHGAGLPGNNAHHHDPGGAGGGGGGGAAASSQSSDPDKPRLPPDASQKLFQCVTERWRQIPPPSSKQQSIDALTAFCDAARFPLSELPLTGAPCDERLLAELVAAHASTLDSIDIVDMKRIDGAVLHAKMEIRHVHLPRLHTLRSDSIEVLMCGRWRPRSAARRALLIPTSFDLGEMYDESAVAAAATDAAAASVNDERMDWEEEAMPPCATCHGAASSTLPPDHDETRCEESIRDCPACGPHALTERAPNLLSLCLARAGYQQEADDEDVPTTADTPPDHQICWAQLLARLVRPLHRLAQLDLSQWTRLNSFRCLVRLSNTLTSLVLFDVPRLYEHLDVLVQLRELRRLDISQTAGTAAAAAAAAANQQNPQQSAPNRWPQPAGALYRLVSALTHLEQLDISGTNLAAPPTPGRDWPVREDGSLVQLNQGRIPSDIVVLRFLARPLQFLGIFNCDNAAHVAQLPAKRVAGEIGEDQILLALEVYRERPTVLQAVLNESYQLYRFASTEPLRRHCDALHGVLRAMCAWLHDSSLQIAGSAALFYIIRKVQMNRDTKRKVVSALLNGMEAHLEEQAMVRNGCLSLCQFDIPSEILADYGRLATLLVGVLKRHNQDSMTQRIAVFLLNSMACHVEGELKVQIGELGAIHMMLDQIRRKLEAGQCDDVMEVAWSFLWNITDETPANCQSFLTAQGLELFRNCFAQFPEKTELVRNMMGLIGNIAEVDDLRGQLMRDDYIRIFQSLLMVEAETIEIAYNAAGVLAHLVSDGEKQWCSFAQNAKIKRADVQLSIQQVTQTWDINAHRFINYRSFRPILRLLPLDDCAASQMWATWALANLTTTDGKKYCAYVVREGGVPMLEQLALGDQTPEPIRRFAQIVLANIAEQERADDVPFEESNPRTVA